MKSLKYTAAAAAILGAAASLSARTYVATPAYQWQTDTMVQGPFKAWAPSAHNIVSTYSAQPGYFMPINKEWKCKNNIDAYPQLSTPDRLHTAIYNMGLDEMVNAVEPDTTLRTGAAWPGVWTRDVSYSILLSMAYMQPEATRISLMRKVDPLGRIIQDTGSGGAWPVSTDRMIWAPAAYELYLVNGDKDWLRYIYPVIKKSLYDDRDNGFYGDNGLVKGETSFIDWREQSHPRWMQTADIYRTEALGTSVVHARAWKVLADIARELGDKKVAADAQEQSQKISDGINRALWMPEKGYYAMYRYGRDNLITNPRAETLGEALSVMWDVADADRAKTIAKSVPVTPYGAAIFYPQIADMPAYHNNALWPWVGAWWALANAKAGNEQGVMQAIGSVYRPAALFATNKENFNLDNGDIATELNSSNMLWCLAGNIAITHKLLFGIDFTQRGLAFHPFVPRALEADRTLDGFKYRGATLNINIHGYGDSIVSFKVNGKEQAPLITPQQAAKAKRPLFIEIAMNNRMDSSKINEQKNLKAPLTPIAWLDEGNILRWNPIEYIGSYVVLRNGQRVATVHTTSFDASQPGEYQVIGVAEDGTESFASEPRSNRSVLRYEMPGEGTALVSPEIAYKPNGAVHGYTGNGFVETDHNTAPVEVAVEVPEDGVYNMTLVYANGNGPVNTENRCAVRTVSVDGHPVGTVVMPQRGRGNWDDWGSTNSLPLSLSPGQHVISISLLPHNENMNRETNHAAIDALLLTR